MDGQMDGRRDRRTDGQTSRMETIGSLKKNTKELYILKILKATVKYTPKRTQNKNSLRRKQFKQSRLSSTQV